MMISTPRRAVHVYTEKENETPKVFTNTPKNHGSNLHRTPLADINGQKLTVYDVHRSKRSIESTRESCQTPGGRNGRRSLKLDCVKQCLNQPANTDRKEKHGIPHKDENIPTILNDLPAVSSIQRNISTSELGHSLISCDDFNSATLDLISSSVEPVHCSSSSVISLTSINSEEFLKESEQLEESILIEKFVGDVIAKAQRTVLEELGSAAVSNEANQLEKQLLPLKYAAKDDVDVSSTEEGQGLSQDFSFTEVDVVKEDNFTNSELGYNTASDRENHADRQIHLSQYAERDEVDGSSNKEEHPPLQDVSFTEVNITREENVTNSENESLMPSYFEVSPNREADFLELVSIRSSPALEEILESSRDDRLSVCDNSCLSQNLEGETDDVSEISLENFFHLQQQMTKGQDGPQANLLLQLTPTKILSSAPQIVPVFEHAVFTKSEYEVALCSGNLWYSNPKPSEVVSTPIKYMHQSTLTSPRLLVSRSDDGVRETGRFSDFIENTEGNHEDVLTTPVSQTCLTSSLSLKDHSQMTTPVRGVNEETSMTPSLLHVPSCNTSPVKVSDQSTVMSPLEVNYQSCNTSPIEKFSKETETVPPSTQDAAVGGCAVMTDENSTQMTPSQSCDKECGTTPLTVCNTSQMTTPVRGVNEETCMTPTCLKVRSCNTSPIKVSDQSTVMSPLEVKYQSSNTSPIKTFSKETETVHISTQDAAVGGTAVTTNEGSTQMTPSQSHDKECGKSPLTVCNTSQMTTPVSSEDAETCTSPLLTSPLRLSSFSRKSENSMALMDQMKSSYISNKLLRREVSSMKKHRTLWEEHLQKEQQEMRKRMSLIKHKETEIHQAKRAAKASVQSEIDDLLTQVGQQLTQIGELEQTVQQKNDEIANLTSMNEDRKKKYCDEVKELQDDLCLAYKQHEAEVAELKEKLEKQTDYEKLYHKSLEKNKRLEEEVHAFTELKEALTKATEMQKKMTIVSETFSAIKSLFLKTLGEKSGLEMKEKELDLREAELSKQLHKSSEETQYLTAETKRLQELVDEERKKSIFVEAERERLQDELVTSQREKSSLQKSLKEALEEIETMKSDGEELRGEITRLKDAELLARASQQEREDELASEISDVRNTNAELRKTIDEMSETKERLTNELETMKTKYSEAVRKEDALRVQLKNEEESKEFIQTESESIGEYVKELEEKLKTTQQECDNCKMSLQDAQKAIQNYEMMIQNIGEHLRSCKNELEHTRQRAHHMIMHQGAQISSASVALQDLTNRLMQSFPDIGTDVNSALQEVEKPTGGVKEGTPPEGDIQSSSLVFSILNSPLPVTDRPELCNKGNALNVSNVPSHTKVSSVPVEYSSSQLQERNLIGQSVNSAFSRVSPANSSVEESDLSIGEHVQKVSDLFNLLTERIYHKMQKADQKIKDLEARSDQLMKDLQKSRKQYDSYVLQLQNQLQDSELQVRHLRQELQSAFSRTFDDQEKLQLALREAQTAELCSSQNSENKLTILRLQKEIEKLMKELKTAELNRQMYQEQVTSLTNLISNKGSPDIKQTMALLSKITADHSKLKKEMRIVEENWQKAEAEVKSLDSLLHHCVKLLEKVPQHVTNSDRNLQTLTGILLSP